MFQDPLCDHVQHNCNIADARHAANYTLCTYLMKMREYYRWEKGCAYDEILPKEDVGAWVAERESLWEELEEANYVPIEVAGKQYDPFDTDAINKVLADKGMVYSGGIGHKAMPHFFLGELETAREYEGYQITISAQECARDLSAPPAMTLGNTIFIRKESIRRMLWEKFQEWQWHKYENAMAKALQHYDFENNMVAELERMTQIELESVVLHEIGEIKSANLLGEGWKPLLLAAAGTRLELMLRAAKDLFADALSTLPMLLQNNHIASIDFYAANMTALRKDLCPSFADQYAAWQADQDENKLVDWVKASAEHWQNVLTQALAKHQNDGSLVDIETLLETNRL